MNFCDVNLKKYIRIIIILNQMELQVTRTTSNCFLCSQHDFSRNDDINRRLGQYDFTPSNYFLRVFENRKVYIHWVTTIAQLRTDIWIKLDELHGTGSLLCLNITSNTKPCQISQLMNFDFRNLSVILRINWLAHTINLLIGELLMKDVTVERVMNGYSWFCVYVKTYVVIYILLMRILRRNFNSQFVIIIGKWWTLI